MVIKEQPFPIQVKSELLAREDEFAATLQSIGIDAQRFIRVGLLYVTQNKNLWICSKSSIVLALLESARAGLMVDGKQAAILPYKDQATFMPMTFGIIALMLRSPRVMKIEARAVYDGDDFAFQYGIRPDLEHTPRVIPSDDTLTYAYAVMWRERAPEPTFEVMSREEIEIVRATSRNAHHADSPWVNWYSEMARKSAVKRLSKYADLAPEAQRAIQMDHEIFGDPSMGSPVEGLSDDYRNQLTKTRTQAGIAKLKEEMANGKDAVESGEEVEEEDAPDSEDELERAKQFVEEIGEGEKDSGEPPKKSEAESKPKDSTTLFWELTRLLKWDKHTVADFLVGVGFKDTASMSKEDFAKAHEALKEQHGGPE